MRKILLITLLFLYNISFGQGEWRSGIFSCNGNAISVFDPGTCVFTDLCVLDIHTGSDITITPNGTLYSIGFGYSGSSIRKIDTASSSVTVICEIPISSSTSLTYLNDSILLTDLFDTLWSINLHTCAVAAIGKIGYSPQYVLSPEGDTLSSYSVPASDGDLCWHHGFLYTISRGRLFRMELNASGTEIIESKLINHYSIKIPTAFGIESLNYHRSPYTEYLIISGDANSAYFVDPLTGEFDTLCNYGELTSLPYGFASGSFFAVDPPPVDTPDVDTPEVDTPDIDTTDVDIDSTTSINTRIIDGNIGIFPNPSLEGQVTIKSYKTDDKIQTVHAFAIDGSRLNIQILRQNDLEYKVKFPQEQKGVVILRIALKSGSIVRKITLF